jgi:glycosyltransferase involved in cell wall biosynthesis
MPDLAIFILNLNFGGAEKNAVVLANEFARLGKKVDLVVLDDSGVLVKNVSKEVDLVNLRTRQILYSMIAIAKYLLNAKPKSILVFMFPYTLLVALICKIFSPKTKVVVTERTALDYVFFHGKYKKIKIYLSQIMMRVIYPITSSVVLVSEYALHVLQNFLNLTTEKINFKVIYNSCVFLENNTETVSLVGYEDWSNGNFKKILAVGRLDKYKDFVPLIESFYLLSQVKNVKLMLVGEGKERKTLEDLVDKLELREKVFFAGFQNNVSNFYQVADLLVLSSIKEGMPNVLLEALQFGLTIVSTDCETGPSEILAQGQFGILVPIQDPQALNTGMLKGLNHPYDKDFIKLRVNDFSLEKMIQAYNQILFCEEM